MTIPSGTIPSYVCPACGRIWAADRPRWRCECGSHFDLSPGTGLSRTQIAAGDASLWRYAAALALRGPPRVTLGEGWTALVRRDWQGAAILFKLESQMPTGSFKDRGSAVMINHLAGSRGRADPRGFFGQCRLLDRDLCGRCRHSCRVYVPAAAPRAKLVQIAATGAEIRAIPGTREAVTEAALAAAGESFYASHNWHPYFIEGTKTLAFELWEQLGFRLPDNILVPTGYGSNILGLDRGFDELERAGEIGTAGEIGGRPRLYAVQAANCAALAAAWAADADGFVPFASRPTIADGIATMRPVRAVEVLRALRRSRGGVVAVGEDEIVPALRALGRLGLFVEPTAATAGAALTRLLREGTIHPQQTTVVVLTGHGLKAAERIGEALDIAPE